jgi:copper chaperone CopZ
LKALTDLRGVVEANVDLQIGTAVVTVIVEGVTLQPLSQAEEAGYRARVLIPVE